VSPPWNELETIIRRDPGGRGVCRFLDEGVPLGYGQLQAATEDLAATARAVAIVTGFCIVDASPPAAETDGPPGALFLARALNAVGVRVSLISDRFGLPLLAAGRRVLRLDDVELCDSPLATEGNAIVDQWIDTFWRQGIGHDVTHLVAIERAGPSHTVASLAAQGADRETMARFEREVPAEHRDVCHNMRGIDITPYTAPTHLLFETAARQGHRVRTIGIADGGNELGMGSFVWATLAEAIAHGPAAVVPCRIAADHTILAGVSNWGGYALGLAIAQLKGVMMEAQLWTVDCQRELIEALVGEAGAVDGVTKNRQPTVDGMPLEEYLEVLAELRAALGLSP
jgi:hypothetical protein